MVFSLLLTLPLSSVPLKMSHSEVPIFLKKMLNFVAWERQDKRVRNRTVRKIQLFHILRAKFCVHPTDGVARTFSSTNFLPPYGVKRQR